jgi:septum formation protein
VIGKDTPLGLGSRSPRRRELLETVRIPVAVLAAEADESVRPSDSPASYLERVTLAKLEAAVRTHAGARVGAWLAADTVVLVDGVILGKPTDVADAERMIALISGRAHQVETRFVIADPEGRVLVATTVRSDVLFRTLDAGEIAGYAASGEGLDKAGAYAVQGLGSFAIARIEGSYTNVVGLPVCEVVVALKGHGLLGPLL